jgi:ethanolamine utilization protein EutN
MFLARIDGTLTAAKKHELLGGVRFLLAQRLEASGATSGEPLVLLDRMGARRGSIVLVSTDGDLARQWLGVTVPARLVVVGIVDRVGRETDPDVPAGVAGPNDEQGRSIPAGDTRGKAS